MALISFLPSNDSHSNPRQRKSKNKKSRSIKKKTKTPPSPPPPPTTSSWEQFKNLLSCKNANDVRSPEKKASKKYTKLRSTCGASSICAVRDTVHVSTTARVADHGSGSDGGSHINETTPLSAVRSGGRMNLMKFSGCYECHAVDVHSASRRYPRPRTLCPCTECGEVFTKSESLEIHQAIRHAVSKLGPEDSSRNIVEIIFKSSWLNKDPQICTISRILKVHNTQPTISRFEDYRDTIKIRSQHPNLFTKNSSKNPRCAADGNELLRFYSTSISCSLGSNGSTSLCLSSNQPLPCGVCRVIRHGLEATAGKGVGTYASSGRAHELGSRTDGPIRAMLVCRVIAGKVRRIGDGVDSDDVEGYDSFAKDGALEDLFVHNPRAILPCFVVIYKA